MRKNLQSILGVTLLEIMLVLAIASMIIVMSIRYYQSASSNQRVANAADLITGITGAAESIIQSGTAVNSVTSTQLATFLPGAKMPISPWGVAVTAKGSGGVISISMGNAPGIDCSALSLLLKAQTNVSLSTCAASGSSSTLTVSVTP